MTKLCTIAFDFDGTLVDSAPGILSGLRTTLEKNQIVPHKPLTKEIIGPPLKQTVALLCNEQDDHILSRLVSDFKEIYDTEAYKHTTSYPGTDCLLATLVGKGHELLLATNKRSHPTHLILRHFGWEDFFTQVYCLDEHPECSSKNEMLSKLLKEQHLIGQKTPYVGDTNADAQAAMCNQMPYIHVNWGYGSFTGLNALQCSTTDELLGHLEAMA